MELIIIDNINYILGDYILNNAPIYSKGCRSSRDLVRTKKIDAFKFSYVRKINDSWIKSDGKSVKFDKVIINADIIKIIPELNNKNEIINDDNGIEKAPNIIYLNDDEKFKDSEDNILEIETRGEREYNKIYFKVKDVAISFNMTNLYTTLIGINSGYEINKDYKYYICNNLCESTIHYIYVICDKFNNYNKYKKELFLTYEGFLKLIHISRNHKFNNTNIHIIKKWLDKFDILNINNFNINLEDIKNSNKNGYIYIVTSELLNFVKIGMWRNSISSLYSRYITYYGNNINIQYFYVNNVRNVEYNTHKYFKNYNISNELFDKKYYDDYIKYLNNISNM